MVQTGTRFRSTHAAASTAIDIADFKPDQSTAVRRFFDLFLNLLEIE
jgi:hypothetical protein